VCVCVCVCVCQENNVTSAGSVFYLVAPGKNSTVSVLYKNGIDGHAPGRLI